MGCNTDEQRRNDRNKLDIANIFRCYGEDINKDSGYNFGQLRAKNDIVKCRTMALGGHLDQCTKCGHQRPSYNSCRNRHCPKCQALSQAKWIAKRKERILPTRYFHVVFTLPAQLRSVTFYNPYLMYDILFSSAAKTLKTLIQDQKRIGGIAGITMVLHTWTRELVFHPHVHCIVTGGGYDAKNHKWHAVKGDYLLPGIIMAKMFKGKFLDALNKAYQNKKLRLEGKVEALNSRHKFDNLKNCLYQKKWVVYAKQTFGNAKQVFEYLGRYTHRVAISNSRLISISDKEVVFYTKNNKTKALHPKEFVRRFLNHVLPKRYVKIRHYGLNAGSNVNTKLAAAKQLLSGKSNVSTNKTKFQSLPWSELFFQLTGIDISCCPKCKSGTLHRTPLVQSNRKPYEDTS